MLIIPKAHYTLDASEKTITLINPFDNIEKAEIVQIYDINTNDMIYDVSIKRDGVSLSGGVITYTADSNIVSDDDDLRILIERKEFSTRDYTYELIQRGLVYRNFHKFDILDDDSNEIIIRTGSKQVFIFLDTQGDGDIHIQFYREPTLTDDGIEMNSGNFNFLHALDLPLTDFFHTPTVTDDGLYIANTWILGGSGVGTPASSITSASMRGLDIVLEPNVTYMIRFTNYADRDIKILFEATFRESDVNGII